MLCFFVSWPQSSLSHPSPVRSGQTARSVEKPTLVADKISYLPGETIIFSGGSWKPGEGVTIVIKTDSAGIVATVHGSG